jgi:hypothetical protein
MPPTNPQHGSKTDMSRGEGVQSGPRFGACRQHAYTLMLPLFLAADRGLGGLFPRFSRSESRTVLPLAASCSGVVSLDTRMTITIVAKSLRCDGCQVR